MIRKIDFLRAEQGSIAIAAAIAAPVLLMLAGGAADVHRTEQARLRLQDALDAAVLAGMIADADGDTDAAQEVFAANKAPGVPAADFDLVSGDMEGEVTIQVPTTFLQLIGVSYLPATAFARAKVGDVSPPCVITLEPENTGLLINSGSELDAAGCAVNVHSSSEQAVLMNSGAKLFSQSLCVQGEAERNSGSKIQPAALTNCTPTADPLASAREPTVPGPCPDRTANSGAVLELTPGCYGRITINSGSTATMAPGVYRIENEFQINSGGKVQAPQVGIYLSSANSKLLIDSGGTLELSAPTSGPMQGFAVFQTRTAANANSGALVFNSGAHGLLEGVVYAPHADMVLNSNASHDADYTLLITKSLNLNSGAKIDINTNYNAGPPLPRAMLPIYLHQ